VTRVLPYPEVPVLVGNAVPLPRALVHAASTAVVVGLGHAFATVVAYLIAGPTGSVATFVVVQAVLGLVLLVGLVRWRAAAGLRRGLPAVPWSGAPALLGYLLAPASWTAQAVAGGQVVGVPAVAWAVDLLLWGAAVAVGVLWAASQEELREAPLTPYG
jgi:hypothetical protein